MKSKVGKSSRVVEGVVVDVYEKKMMRGMFAEFNLIGLIFVSGR